MIKLKVERYPLLDNKPALMRAYKQTTLKDGDGDAWVERKEFPALIRNVFYFNKLFHVFDAIDRDDDRRVDEQEFLKSASLIGLTLPADQLKQEFSLMDRNGGGLVLFDEMAPALMIRNKRLFQAPATRVIMPWPACVGAGPAARSSLASLAWYASKGCPSSLEMPTRYRKHSWLSGCSSCICS